MACAPALLVRLVAAAALLVVADVHLDLAAGNALVGEQVTLGDLFRVQAAVAGVVALAALVWPVRVVWLVAAAVGFASLLAVVVTVYVVVPSVGPLPRIFEPVWYPEKVIAAVAAGAAVLAALAGLLLAVRQGRPSPAPADAAARPVSPR